MKLAVLEKDDIHKKSLLLLKENGIKIVDLLNTDKKKIEAVFIRTYTKITREFLKDYPNLKYILRAGVGLDNVDVKACKEKGICVFNSPGSNANAVSELIILYILLYFRKMLSQMDLLKSGKWRERAFIGEELKNKTVGIIGCGAIGQLIAKKIQGFEVKEVLGYDPNLSEDLLKNKGIIKTGFNEILKKSDVITLHLPLTPKTKNLISNKEFSLMKKNCFLINTSRGGIVNEKDLISVLKTNKIAGAAFDVFENEPDVNPELLKLNNLIATPHIAGFTKEADEAMSVQAAENFLKFLNTG